MNRDLDITVAREVFGVEVEFVNQKGGWRVDYRAKDDICNDDIKSDWGVEEKRLRFYSNDLLAAFDALEHLYPDDDPFDIQISKEVNEGFAGYHAAIPGFLSAEGATKAEAISKLAVLIARNRKKGDRHGRSTSRLERFLST